MTTQELLQYYSNLLLLQYRGQPNATAMIEAFIAPIVMDQLPLAIENGFQIGENAANPDNPPAVGIQLDVIGKYLGVLRNGVGVYQQPITLNDSDFTQLIKLAVAVNNLGSSLSDIDNFLQLFFPNEMFIYDGEDMFVSYLITGSIGSENLIQMFVTENLLPKPMGVGVSSIIYINEPGLFSFLSYEQFTVVLGDLIFNIPNWSSSVTYSAGQQVYSGGIVYSSINNGNLNNAVTNAAFWTPVIFPMTTYNGYTTYTQTPAYTGSWTWLSYSDTIIIPT